MATYTVTTKKGERSVDSPFPTDKDAAAFLALVPMPGEFAESLVEKLERFGALSDKQRAWLHVIATEKADDDPQMAQDFLDGLEKSQETEVVEAPKDPADDIPF